MLMENKSDLVMLMENKSDLVMLMENKSDLVMLMENNSANGKRLQWRWPMQFQKWH